LPSVLVPLFSGLVTYGSMPAFLRLLQKGEATRLNYRGAAIPVGAGFLFLWIGCLTELLLLLPFSPDMTPRFSPTTGLLPQAIPLFITTALGYGLLGLFDDLVGSRRETGLKGHGAALRRGELTTGTIKALAGVAFGLMLAVRRLGVEGWMGRYWIVVVFVDGLLIAASANTLNLLDLRPGRSGKVFFGGALLIMLSGNPTSLALLPWMGSTLGYLPFDLKGEAMMGDVGSNALGALLGLASCYVVSLGYRSVLLLSLILVHLLAERISFSKVIEHHPLLRVIDGWGRKDT
jgi:UDP-GlcNAc:undecaprenyl-phosphate GlcNAc-1-phosphate transferase